MVVGAQFSLYLDYIIIKNFYIYSIVFFLAHTRPTAYMFIVANNMAISMYIGIQTFAKRSTIPRYASVHDFRSRRPVAQVNGDIIYNNILYGADSSTGVHIRLGLYTFTYIIHTRRHIVCACVYVYK